ncbi:hypothetical protein ACHAW5_010319 [Stephanodiscus triporus]|uniref:NADP-dependent oxidoreductase domain-containing protein n=1 Tax=Stephanodiscus triporus TaxID=2934178 RepID=A0ABD3Q6V0_9STRA
MDGEIMNYRLVDASHADSALEALVGRSLGRIPPARVGAADDVDDSDDVYHVMVKVWHTHLGYERTMMSVRDSLSDILPGDVGGGGGPLAPRGRSLTASGGRSSTAAGGGGKTTTKTTTPDVRVHAILRYPRCYDELFESSAYLNSPNFPTKYANCAEEEEALDQSVKDASDGVSPLSDKDGAWERSYRALEELYHRGVLESIGVGDFGPSDLSRLFEIATVGPHVYQGTLRTLLTQEELVEDLVRHGVHYQCHDAVSTVLRGREGAPIAYSKLGRIGARHGGLMDGGDSGGGKSDDAGGGANEDVYGYSPIQVVLGYLIHHRGVGVVPGTTDVSHLAENSPSSLGNMRRFSPREALDIETALLALVNGEDVAPDAGNVSNMMGGSAKGAEKVITAAGSMQDAAGDGDDDSGMEGGVVATFFNTLPHPRSVRIFHVHPETGEQIQLSHGIPPGRSGRMIVNVDDVLIAYDAHGVAVKKFLVEGSGNESNGVSLDFTVESS